MTRACHAVALRVGGCALSSIAWRNVESGESDPFSFAQISAPAADGEDFRSSEFKCHPTWFFPGFFSFLLLFHLHVHFFRAEQVQEKE
jgi:hypothetical protein